MNGQNVRVIERRGVLGFLDETVQFIGVFAALFSTEEFGRFEQQVQGYAFGEALAQLGKAAAPPRV